MTNPVTNPTNGAITPNLPVLNPGQNTFNYLWYMFLSNIGQSVSTNSGIGLDQIETLLLSIPQTDPNSDVLQAQINQLNSVISSLDVSAMQNVRQQLEELWTGITCQGFLDTYIQQLETRISQLEALRIPDESARISQLESKLAELDSYMHTLPVQN